MSQLLEDIEDAVNIRLLQGLPLQCLQRVEGCEERLYQVVRHLTTLKLNRLRVENWEAILTIVPRSVGHWDPDESFQGIQSEIRID